MENPYPKDIFKWDNEEKLDFNRGRFNQHCFEVWENCIKDVLKLIDEKEKLVVEDGINDEVSIVNFVNELKSQLEEK